MLCGTSVILWPRENMFSDDLKFHFIFYRFTRVVRRKNGYSVHGLIRYGVFGKALEDVFSFLSDENSDQPSN